MHPHHTRTHLRPIRVAVLLVVLPRRRVCQRLVRLGDELCKVLASGGVRVLRGSSGSGVGPRQQLCTRAGTACRRPPGQAQLRAQGELGASHAAGHRRRAGLRSGNRAKPHEVPAGEAAGLGPLRAAAAGVGGGSGRGGGAGSCPVGVKLERQLAVRLLDLLNRGAPLDVQDLVGVEHLDLLGHGLHVPQQGEPDQPQDDGDDARCGGSIAIAIESGCCAGPWPSKIARGGGGGEGGRGGRGGCSARPLVVSCASIFLSLDGFFLPCEWRCEARRPRYG
jgi:hypothetical protein